ncbi:hypothetical protein [Lignipirellula cremea]|uniref:Uncharacterized protein n=1 Tax=Lignipirellula cremea TaxID=2528010 RepID=A0A518DRI1_9BACT|nr:hypothetical protein [Lignipirellula cremea]QDU94450.1 hypothetical protein Pla8534_22410 [Lignipirellula cremea]
MRVVEIRQPEQARTHLLQSLWLMRAAAPTPARAHQAFAWAHEIAANGDPLPPLGLVADMGLLALGVGRESGPATLPEPPGFDPSLVRRYEDYVLGKLYADHSFERGCDALYQFSDERERSIALAWLIQQFRQRAELPSVLVSPAVLKGLRDHTDPAQLLAEGWELLESSGLSDRLREDYEDLTLAVRNAGDVLGAEDVLELERGVVLQPFADRIALRQVWHAADQIERLLPHVKVRPSARHSQAATHLLEEDIYPVGGFNSISNRGGIESLLHSQLAYMETDEAERPDLFDIKFLRDELLYYSRDENQFLRRRQMFFLVLSPDLVEARIKDAGAPCQRIILLLAALLAAIHKLSDWLSTDALHFEVVLLTENGPSPLVEERQLLRTLLHDEIAAGTASVTERTPRELQQTIQQQARRSLCHCLLASTGPRWLDTAAASTVALHCEQLPALAWREGDATSDRDPDSLESAEPLDPLDAWQEAIAQLLPTWI